MAEAGSQGEDPRVALRTALEAGQITATQYERLLLVATAAERVAQRARQHVAASLDARRRAAPRQPDPTDGEPA